MRVAAPEAGTNLVTLLQDGNTVAYRTRTLQCCTRHALFEKLYLRQHSIWSVAVNGEVLNIFLAKICMTHAITCASMAGCYQHQLCYGTIAVNVALPEQWPIK